MRGYTLMPTQVREETHKDTGAVVRILETKYVEKKKKCGNCGGEHARNSRFCEKCSVNHKIGEYTLGKARQRVEGAAKNS